MYYSVVAVYLHRIHILIIYNIISDQHIIRHRASIETILDIMQGFMYITIDLSIITITQIHMQRGELYTIATITEIVNRLLTSL